MSDAMGAATTSVNSQALGGEIEFADFMKKLDDYSPTVPEAVINYYFQRGGAAANDERLIKLVSLAADRFLAVTVFEATLYQQARALREKDERNEDVDTAQDECLRYEDLAMTDTFNRM